MKCPFCGHPDTQVNETRPGEDGSFVRRRRRCPACDRRFTTYERCEASFAVIVKKDGRRVDYERAKLRSALAIALRKRPVAAARVDAAIERIEEHLRQPGVREVSSSQIGELVMHELRLLDQIAYIRFASVYRNFAAVQDFTSVMDELRDPGKS